MFFFFFCCISQNNPINKDLGLQFACLCPAFSDTAMFQQMHSANPPYLFYDEAKQIVLRNINELGINRYNVFSSISMTWFA